MADQNLKVAFVCHWCGASFHDVQDEHSMAPIPVYIDNYGNQFDTKYCRKMFKNGFSANCGGCENEL